MKHVKNKHLTLFVLICCLLMLTGCVEDVSENFDYTLEHGGAYRFNSTKNNNTSESGDNSKYEVKIISTYNITSETLSINEDLQTIEDEVHKLDGYVNAHKVDVNKNGRNDKRTVDLSIKVPQNEVSNMLKSIRNTLSIKSESSESVEITSVFQDIESSLNSLKNQEVKLNQMYEKADTIDELLLIEENINKINTERNKLNKKLIEMENKSTYASIDINIREVDKLSVPFNKGSVHKIAFSLKQSAINIKNMVVTVVVLIIDNVVYIVIAYILFKIYKRFVTSSIKSEESNNYSEENILENVNNEDKNSSKINQRREWK